MDVALMKMEENIQSNGANGGGSGESNAGSPAAAADIMRMLTDASSHVFANLDGSPKSQLELILAATGFDDQQASSATSTSAAAAAAAAAALGYPDLSPFASLRNSSKTLKCPKCNWHYKYQETLEIHMREKHNEGDVKCVYCVENRPHPKLARGETYSCGYKPYRCDLCRYSTTTKGNLSIHMQSDKHLHAVQELPNSIEFAANFVVPPVSTSSPVDDKEAKFFCLLCGNYATESLSEMIDHVEKDRSRPHHGDVIAMNGNFRCQLCPYHTTLKANFQLHSRTDKHLQKVQTANHLREGNVPHNALHRLSSTKTSVQVLCRTCAEVITSQELLREHCHFAPIVPRVWKCRICSTEFETEQAVTGHMTCHEPSTWPTNTTDNNRIQFKMDEAVYGCAGCAFTTKDVTELEEHSKIHQSTSEVTTTGSENQRTCPLCMESTSEIEKHLVEDHRIAESAIEKLLVVDRQHSKESTSTDTEYGHRCTKCSMAFRTDAQLQSHVIQHVFTSYHKCPTCSDTFEDPASLLTHMMEHNQKEECEMCSEVFSSKEAFTAHSKSAKHLQKAKKLLETSMVDLNSQQIMGDTEKTRFFRCNACNQSYPHANNLDIHLRTIPHQSRMNRLAELVANGEVCGDKQIVEQPGVTNRTIQQVIEQTSSQMAIQDVMSLLLKNETPASPDDTKEDTSGESVYTQIKVYGDTKIINLVPALEGKLEMIPMFDETKGMEISKIDCQTCGQQIIGILQLNLHYEEVHSSSIPNDVLKQYGEKILSVIEEATSNGDNSTKNGSPRSCTSGDDEPAEKRIKLENMIPGLDNPAMANQFAMFSQMMNCFPFMPNPSTSTPNATPFAIPPEMMSQMTQLINPAALAASAAANAANNSPAKRARTRITDDQLKVLRQYFNINNSPSEAQIKEMSIRSQLPEKVIKHWFRNTLFKERQRDKDSPYNFNVPPQMSIDLDTYDKTGEAKVVPIGVQEKAAVKAEPLVDSARSSPILTIPTTSATIDEKPEVKTPTAAIDLQAMLSQMQQASFPFLDANFMAAAAASSPLAQPTQNCNTSSSGRRANRTRFTDFQLRTLQQFFDKQAYPKDDDLEALSKKLQLSPRVIVVWFQNARQKARKIYENQPNHENSDRFVRTPGSNFQCKRCNQVFQRYYELIQHQQKRCYKDDGAALASDNKSVEESLTDEEKAQLIAQQQVALNTFDIQNLQPTDLLKMLGASQTPKSTNDVLLKFCENIPNVGSTGGSRGCPFCTQEFASKSLLKDHCQSKHSELFGGFDVDMLLNMEEMDTKESALDLSGSSIDIRESLSASPARSEDDVLTEALDDSTFATFGVPISTGSECRSPANNKRYRTHLTPLQVQMMKSVFNEYKTPSMAECESLGKEIGLHKRVVQVWFQNARAKERKTKGSVDEESRNGHTDCDMCDKKFSARLSLQDHLFSKEHISLLRSNLKKEGVSDVSPTEGSSSPDKKMPKISGLDMTTLPFLMNPFAFDLNIVGTPIAILQVPDEVKEQIKTDIEAAKTCTVFSQDGQTVDELREILADDEKMNVDSIQKDVGWACPLCTNVFQEEKKLKEHQKVMCTQCDTSLTLSQTHYSCNLCAADFCLQTDYLIHLTTMPHIQKKTIIT